MIVVVVLAIVAAAASIVLFSGRGGADTAAEAAQLLAADLTAGRYVDAFSRLHPSEAAIATDLQRLLSEEFKRLEVLRPEASLGTVDATFNVAGLGFDDAAAEQVRDDVVINKLVAGRITFTQDPSTLPITESFRRLVFPGGLPAAGAPTAVDIADVVREQGEPIRVASVRVDGKWYVSAAYTAADYALRAAGRSWPATSIPARGAVTPRDALRETVQAAMDADVRRLIELAPPSELQVLHDVGEAIVAEAESDARPSGAKLLELETAPTDVPGGTALTVTKVVVQESPRGGRVTVVREDDCLVVTNTGGHTERACGAELARSVPSVLLGVDAAAEVRPQVVKTVLDAKIVMVEEGGQFYLSPTRTTIGLYGDVLRALRPADIANLARLVR